MKAFKKFLTFALVAAMTAMLFANAVLALANGSSVVNAKHYNVMMVVDGSGSLTGRHATDSEGYRYDAVQLFLGLMTNSGNYVGAIVFDDKDPMPLNTDLMPISGSVAKRAIADQIRNAKAGGDTDIGGALLEAANKLSALQSSNGLPSVVVLMSDGMTDLNTQEKLERSYANEERGIQACIENGIPVYSVLLNKDGALESTGELESISTRTGGAYQEVRNSGDLSQVYTLFYSFIYSTDSLTRGGKYKFDDNGFVTIEQEIPGFGIEELNLVANSPSGVKDIIVTRPSGEVIKAEELEDEIIRSSNYEFLKIEKPEAGLWKFEIHGDAGNEVTIDLIFNSDLSLTIDKPDNVYSFEGGELITARAFMVDGRKTLTDEAAYKPEYISAYMVNMDSPSEKVPMAVTGKGNCFELTCSAPAVSEPTSYSIQAELSVTGIHATSNSVVIDVNPAVPENNPPRAVEPVIDHEVKDSGDGSDYITLDGLFIDADGDELSYMIASSDYSPADAALENGCLRIARSVLDGSLTVRASDGKASALVKFMLKGNAKPKAMDNSVKVQIEINKLIGGKSEEVVSFTDWFTDEDGDELSVAVIACDYDYDKDGTIVLSPEQKTLTVRTKDFKKSNMVLRATDPYGAYDEITVHFDVLNWWLIYGGIVTALLIAAGIIIALLAAAKLRKRFKGYIMVENVAPGEYGSNGGGFRTSHPSQRKKLVLNSLYGVSPGEFDSKSAIFPLSAKKIRFKSSKPFYYNGSKRKYVDISMDSSVTIYPTAEGDTTGLLISTESPDNFGSVGGGGGFSDFGGSSDFADTSASSANNSESFTW